MALETGRVSPGGGNESPRAVRPSVPAPPPCSVSGRDATTSLDASLIYARVGQMKGPWLNLPQRKVSPWRRHVPPRAVPHWVESLLVPPCSHRRVSTTRGWAQ